MSQMNVIMISYTGWALAFVVPANHPASSPGFQAQKKKERESLWCHTTINAYPFN